MLKLTILAFLAFASLLVLGLAFAEEPTGLPEPLLKEVRSAQSLPKGRYVLVKVWEAEGKEFGHNVGQRVADPQAEGGMAWEARMASGPEDDSTAPKPSEGAKPGHHLLFGPYVELPPGAYMAFFRLKLLDDPEEEEVCTLDACVSFGHDILSVRSLSASDLVRDQYVQVPLGFRYTGGKLECRLAISDYASLRADRVSLFRLEGSGAGDLSGMAPQPKASGLPTDISPLAGPRPFPDVFPRSSAPAPNLLVADVRGLRRDWQLCLVTLQGIVNRTQPQVYCISNPNDPDWLEWMRKKNWIQGTEPVSHAKELLARFQDRVKGMVITDPQLPATKNVATMIAGVKDAVVVSPRLAKQLSLPVLDDLRGRWQTSAEAYRWAYENLWDGLNHHLLACLWPEYMSLRDYLVQNKAIILWLPGRIDGARKYSRPEEEVRLIEDLLAKLAPNIPVMGYSWAGKDVGIGEGPGVTLFAEFGKYLVGTVNCSNLSVHSGIPGIKFEQRVPPPPTLQKDKVYLSVIISDGDNLPVLTTYNFPQLWKDPLRGQMPLGWTISPSAALLIPDIADYYYSTATPNDCFLGAVSGVGYTYPDSYGKRFKETDRAGVFDGFLDQTRVNMEHMAMKSIWIMGITRPELIQRYAERIPFLEAIFPDYGRRVANYGEATYPVVRNVAVFHAANGWKQDVSREEQIAGIVSQIQSFTPSERPAFLHLFIWNWGCGASLSLIRDVLQRLGPEYLAVRPDHMAALYRQYLTEHPVLIRVPQTLSLIEGSAITFSARVWNTTDKPLDVRTHVASGMERAAVSPEVSRIGPWQTAAVEITGTPSADTVALEWTGAFGTERTIMACHRVSRKEILGALPATATLRFVRLLEAEQLSHRSGKEEKDASASGQAVWSAVRGETAPGHIVYGPYSTLPEGKYLALFRMKRTGEGTVLLAVLDAGPAGGKGSTVREVRADELPLGEYRSIPIVFSHSAGPFETRVMWPGNASISVDSIGVWEIAPIN